jgi:hypothetical protein
MEGQFEEWVMAGISTMMALLGKYVAETRPRIAILHRQVLFLPIITRAEPGPQFRVN